MTFEQATAKLAAWEKERRAAGKKAPAAQQRPNSLSLKVVEKETGVPRNRYDREGKPLRRLLMEIVERLGGLEVEWDHAQFKRQGVHLQQLRGRCLEHYQKRCYDLAKPYEKDRHMLERLFGVLFTRADSIDGAVSARPAVEAFRAAIARGEVVKGDTFLAYVETALDLLAQEERRTALPETFAQRLDHVVRAAGLSRSKAAKRIGVIPGTFNSWCSGAKSPDQSAFPAIARLEALLDLEPETLTGVIEKGILSAGRYRAELFPEHLQGVEHAGTRSEVGRHMPKTFFALPYEAQRGLVAAKVAELEAAAHKKRLWYEIRQDRYALDAFPPELEKEWLDLLDFKSGRTTLRNDQQRPLFAAKRWETEDTIKTNRARIAGYFGYLVNHAEAGRRQAPGQLALLALSDHTAMLSFLHWKAERQAPYWDDTPRITKSDLDLVTTAGALLSIDDGFLRYHPRYSDAILALGERYGIPRVSGNSLEEQHYRAIQDRHVICNRLLEDLDAIEGGYRYRTSSNRQHQSRLDLVLDLEQPLAEFYRHLEDRQAALRRMKKDVRGYHRGLRACALMHVLSQRPLRRSTTVRLDFRYDNTGNLRYVENKWLLVIPTAWFKNKSSDQFDGLEEIILPLEDVHGCYEILELYTSQARPALLDGVQSDALFVSTPANPRYSRQGLDNLYRGITKSFVADLPSAELLPAALSVHDMRDVVATSVIKVSGSFELAADAILDAPSTVRRAYARWQPKHRIEQVRAAMERARGLSAKSTGSGSSGEPHHPSRSDDDVSDKS